MVGLGTRKKLFPEEAGCDTASVKSGTGKFGVEDCDCGEDGGVEDCDML